MAKNNRFPSPANVAVDKSGKPLPAKAVQAPLPEGSKLHDPNQKVVNGSKVDLVGVHHKGVNNVVLHNGTHALAPGLNWVPREVIVEAAKHPHVAKLIKDGVLKIQSGDEAEPEAEAKAEAPAEEKSEEAKASEDESA